MTRRDTAAAARALLLHRVSQGFSHPSRSLHASMASGEFREEIGALCELLGGRFHRVPDADPCLERFEAGYIRLFQVGDRGRPLVGLHTGDHEALLLARTRTEVMLDYSRWYRHFGLRVSGNDPCTGLPDHLVCQLEFSAWLAQLEAEAGSRSSARIGYRRAQRDFAERHLGPLLARIARRLAELTDAPAEAPLFAALAELALMGLAQVGPPATEDLGSPGDRSGTWSANGDATPGSPFDDWRRP